ncbi:hypothetical protein ACSFA0_25040 [Variovorax sp. LT1P1]|uniref:competence protein CoiA family protein n=1 Tax=Variovorax sp. LT1P1 TaxID=3443730 RepID=UPI003F456D39
MTRFPIFAGLDAHGVTRFVADVPGGAACGCHCAACGAALVAKRGDVKIWHFAHEASQERPECFAGAVNLLRRLAAQYLAIRSPVLTPTAYVVVDTSAPLPHLTERVAWEPGLASLIEWNLDAPRHAPMAAAELASGLAVPLHIVITGTAPVPGPQAMVNAAISFEVGFPDDAVWLKSAEAATQWIRLKGKLRWLAGPDNAQLRAAALTKLEAKARELQIQQRSQDQRIQQIWNAQRRGQVASARSVAPVVGDRYAADRAEHPVPAPPAAPRLEPSPWARWRNPNSSMIFYGATAGTGWLVLQHQDGRSVAVPWPSVEEGWDEELPARIGTPDSELGGVVLANLAEAMMYLGPIYPGLHTFGSWEALSDFMDRRA